MKNVLSLAIVPKIIFLPTIILLCYRSDKHRQKKTFHSLRKQMTLHRKDIKITMMIPFLIGRPSLYRHCLFTGNKTKTDFYEETKSSLK